MSPCLLTCQSLRCADGSRHVPASKMPSNTTWQWHLTWHLGGFSNDGSTLSWLTNAQVLRVEFSPLFNRKWLALQVCNSCAGVGHWSPTLHCQSQLVWMWFEMNEEKDIWAFQGVTKIQPCIYIYTYIVIHINIWYVIRSYIIYICTHDTVYLF